jgi:hypothetical protein
MIYYIDAVSRALPSPEGRPISVPGAARALSPTRAGSSTGLEEEHRVGAHKIRSLEQALARYQSGGQREFAQFAAAGRRLRRVHWQPYACRGKRADPARQEATHRRGLGEIDRAFLGHADPLVGMDAARNTAPSSRRIVNLRRRRSDWGRHRGAATPTKRARASSRNSGTRPPGGELLPVATSAGQTKVGKLAKADKPMARCPTSVRGLPRHFCCDQRSAPSSTGHHHNDQRS